MADQPRYTRTFIEHSWHQRPQGGAPNQWQEIPRSETREVPLDEQVRNWVKQTGNLIIHPGQLGIHTQWHDEQLTLRCVTLGLTVLFITPEPSNGKSESPSPAADPSGVDPGGAVANPRDESQPAVPAV